MKTKIQIISFLLILPILGLCQNKFSVGINTNAQFSLLRINDSQAVGGLSERGGVGAGYSMGIQVQYGLNEKTFLRSGLDYQNRKNRHHIEGLVFGTDIMNSTESSIQNDITITSIGLPIEMGYLFKSKNDRINYTIGFGGAFNVNVDTQTKAKIVNEQVEGEELTQAENIVDESIFTIGIFGGMEFSLSETMILGIEPNLRYTPNSFSLYFYESDASSTFEAGITLRLRMK